MFGDSQTTLETFFGSNWATTQVAWENEPFSSTIVDEYVRFSVQFDESYLAALGTRCHRILGAIAVQVFVRPGVGSARAMQLADAAAALFTNVVVSLHHFTTPRIVKLPAVEPEWYQVQVISDFYIDKELP